jgi:SAM-dependent methyltransferase
MPAPLPFVIDSEHPDLAGNLRHGDTGGFTPQVWDWVVRRFAIRSMLDVGCGEGHAVDHFRRAGVIAHGIDGLEHNIRRAVTPIALHDLKVAPYVMPVDLVLCVEVVEHLKATYLANLLRTLCNGKVILMTHAVPGQEGYHHVDCQPADYWIGKLAELDYRFFDVETNYIRSVAANEGWWNHMTSTGLLFATAS